MEKKVIMLACAAGMSTSLLVSKMQKAATEKGFDAEIFAVAAAEAQDYVEKQHVDVVLLGPQVRFMEADFKKKMEPKGIPVGVIPMADYGMMNGAKVLEFADTLMKDKSMDEKKVQAIMNLIIYGGVEKSSSVEAIQAAKEGNFELADEKIKAAEESLLQAHHTQTEMLTQEANGDSVEVSLLMVHGQDHLMTGMMFKDLAKEIVDVYRTIRKEQ